MFWLKLRSCDHVQWMTYCEGALLSLTRLLTSLLVRFVTAGYAVWYPFKFSPKSIGFPCAKHRFGLIFSCENLTSIPLLEMLLNHWIFWINNGSISAMRVGKITRLALVVVFVVRKCFVQLQARFSSRQEGLMIG